MGSSPISLSPIEMRLRPPPYRDRSARSSDGTASTPARLSSRKRRFDSIHVSCWHWTNRRSPPRITTPAWISPPKRQHVSHRSINMRTRFQPYIGDLLDVSIAFGVCGKWTALIDFGLEIGDVWSSNGRS